MRRIVRVGGCRFARKKMYKKVHFAIYLGISQVLSATHQTDSDAAVVSVKPYPTSFGYPTESNTARPLDFLSTMDQSAVMSGGSAMDDDNNDASSSSLLEGSGGPVLFANERQVVRQAGRQAISEFLSSNTCFSVLRASGKVVVFDVRIPIQLAFYALVEHDMQVAPLWNSTQCQFVGLLTVTDFIDVLRHYRKTGADPSTLGSRSIADILRDGDILQGVLVRFQKNKDTTTSSSSSTVSPYHCGNFMAADTATSLQQACKMLHEHSLDFLPVIMPEDMRVLACISYTTILEFLVTHFREQRRLFDDSIWELGIGTYHDSLITSTPQETLAEALDKLQQHGLSALPVVETTTTTKPIQHRLVGVYSRSDISFLASSSDAADAIHNLELTLGELLQQQRTDVVTTPDALHTCTTQHTLQSIFEYFAQIKFNRLFVLDEQESLMGVVSARDLVAYFLRE